MLDTLGELNRRTLDQLGDPETQTRMAQYEMAFRMQSSVPEVTDLSSEPQHIFDLYGADAKTPGTFAANCLLARRLAERELAGGIRQAGTEVETGQKLLAAARAQPPSEAVPYAFERRILARLGAGAMVPAAVIIMGMARPNCAAPSITAL